MRYVYVIQGVFDPMTFHLPVMHNNLLIYNSLKAILNLKEHLLKRDLFLKISVWDGENGCQIGATVSPKTFFDIYERLENEKRVNSNA